MERADSAAMLRRMSLHEGAYEDERNATPPYQPQPQPPQPHRNSYSSYPGPAQDSSYPGPAPPSGYYDYPPSRAMQVSWAGP